MKYHVLIIIIMALIQFSCCDKNKNTPKDSNKFYYLTFIQGGEKVDTNYCDSSRFDVSNIYFIDSIEKVYFGQKIKIFKVTNLPKAPTDGEFIAYWNNGTGIFYQRLLSWNSFSILRSSNDSINNLILFLTGSVLSSSGMTTTLEAKDSTKIFSTPKVGY